MKERSAVREVRYPTYSAGWAQVVPAAQSHTGRTATLSAGIIDNHQQKHRVRVRVMRRGGRAATVGAHTGTEGHTDAGSGGRAAGGQGNRILRTQAGQTRALRHGTAYMQTCRSDAAVDDEGPGSKRGTTPPNTLHVLLCSGPGVLSSEMPRARLYLSRLIGV